MWDEGQSRPTPEQEHEWERVNKLYNTGGRTISNTAESAEVILETNGVSSTRTVEFGERYNSRGIQFRQLFLTMQKLLVNPPFL